MRIPIHIPQAGTSTEAVFLEWQVAKGSRVEKGQVIATAETDKTVLEIVAESDGVLDEACAEAGQDMPIDQPVGFLATTADAGQSEAPVSAPREAVPVRVEVVQPADHDGARERVEALSPVRRRIAENLLAVVTQTARASTSVEFDYARVGLLREKNSAAFKARHGVSLTFLPFVVRAVCLILPDFPDVCATLDLAGNTWRTRRYVNVGIAVARENGLVVPVLKAAGDMTLAQLATAVPSLVARARNGEMRAEDAQDGTFTITNPGSLGSVFSQPLQNRGETAILSIDAIEKRPVVVDDALAIGLRGYATLAFDHRILDGSTAIAFLKCVNEVLRGSQLAEEAGHLLDD